MSESDVDLIVLPGIEVLDGQVRREIIPYIAITGNPGSPRIGFGYRYPGVKHAGAFLSPALPVRLMSVWWALMMLARLPEVRSETLDACLEINTSGASSAHYEHLSELFGSRQAFDAAWEGVISTPPDKAQMRELLRTLLEYLTFSNFEQFSGRIWIGSVK